MTKIYKTQQEVEADIVDEVLTINSDVIFEVSISIDASIVVNGDIKARDINAWNLNARDINCRDINARNINARNIDARNIDFYAVCFAYEKFSCKSIKGRRENSKYFCLDGEVEIIK